MSVKRDCLISPTGAVKSRALSLLPSLVDFYFTADQGVGSADAAAQLGARAQHLAVGV